MRDVITIVLAFMLAGPVWGQKPEAAAEAALHEGTLNVAVHYLETVLADTQAALERVAAAPEAQKGEWTGIKPLLKRLKEDLPGVYFYIRPNGDYYSVERDFTNLNLSNRPYFGPLFAGEPVKGFPVYSRSTGKKSVVIAVPVMVNGSVTGALGVLVFLDALTDETERVLALPPDYTWFVLNGEGNTILDRGPDYIFMNPLTQGSPSLKAAVSDALKHESGTIAYALDGMRRGYYRKLPRTPWWIFLAKIEGAAATPPKLKLSLDRFVPELQGKLEQIDASVARLIGESRIDATKERAVRTLLRTLLEENPDVITASFVDSQGILRYIEPRDYRNFENSDIGAQEHIAAMRRKPVPTLSGAFTAVEDFLAAVIAYPLPGSGGEFAGALTVLIRPELLVEPLLRRSTIPDDYELWIMQPDGMIVYDQERDEIGRMLFSDHLYEGYDNLLKLGRKIAALPEGEGNYIFLAPGHGEKVIKHALWRTVRLHNREWRVVLAYRPYREQ